MFVNRSGFQNISFFEGVGALFPERLCLNLIPIVNQKKIHQTDVFRIKLDYFSFEHLFADFIKLYTRV